MYLVYINNIEYIYKKVDRLLYILKDSKVLELELRNLE